jgi:hypothetical protein
MVSSLPEIERLLSFAGPVAAGVLILSLWRHGLLRRYRFFAFYLSLLVLEVVVLLSISKYNTHYFEVYVGTESVMWVAQILVITELFSLVVNPYPGIARTARTFIWIAFGAAFLLSTAFAVLSPSAAPGDFPTIQRYLFVSRVISFTVLAFLFLLLAFLLYFPISLSRNVVSYACGYVLYFASRALTRLIGNLVEARYFEVLSVVSLLVVLGCLIFWILFLNRRGEDLDVTLGHRWSPAAAKSLTGQLDAINSMLLRTGRK